MTPINITLPKDQLDQLQVIADREYRTLEGQIQWMLARQLERWSLGKSPKTAPTEADQVFMDALRELYVLAGRPSTRAIAAGAGGMSHTTVADALRGPFAPTWYVASGLVEYFGGDLDKFRELWTAAQQQQMETL